jgi:phage anti-repressor protein
MFSLPKIFKKKSHNKNKEIVYATIPDKNCTVYIVNDSNELHEALGMTNERYTELFEALNEYANTPEVINSEYPGALILEKCGQLCKHNTELTAMAFYLGCRMGYAVPMSTNAK